MALGRHNESQKSILEIQQTQEVTVTYERNGRVDASTVERGVVGLEVVKEARRSRSLS